MGKTMLVVGDVEEECVFLKQIFEGKYFIAQVSNGKDAIKYLENHLNEIAMLFLDIHVSAAGEHKIMEHMIKRHYIEWIPVILITDNEKQELTEYEAEATDMIHKPFVERMIKKRINNILEFYRYKCHKEEQADTGKQKMAELKKCNDSLYHILYDIITNHSVESLKHIQYVQGYTRILAEQYASLYPDSGMTEDKIEMIVKAAGIHDIGKMTIPDSITGRPGRLSQHEMEILKEHTIKGSEIVQVMSEVEEGNDNRIRYNVCRYHHEKYDGTGYPEGMKKDEIPVEAQIVGLADMYDVLVNLTVHKRAFTPKEAFYKLIKGECGELSPQMKECLETSKTRMETFRI